jgi:phosphatidylglycerophosphatase A
MSKMKRFFVTLIATAFGSGFTPKAPGTAGSVIGVIIVYLVRDWGWESYSLLWLAIFLVGWWASLEWSRAKQAKDSQQIVVDEVLGYMIAMAMLPRTAAILWIQFILFRIFDALKPPPIRQLDHWGKKFEVGKIQSLGVILDDILAGLVALGVFYLLKPVLISLGLI